MKSIPSAVHHSNIFDPIEPKLDQRVFRGIEPHRHHIDWILRLYDRGLKERFGVSGDGWTDLYFTGSLTTYQYSETSDADISVFANWDRFLQELNMDAQTARKELVAMSIDHLDGTFLPGTTHPLQFFVVPVGTLPSDLYKPGLRSAYSLDDRLWYQEPEKDRVHNIEQELPEFFSRAADIATKMTDMLDHDPEAARQLWHDVHAKRSLDQQAGLGDFCEGNIVYKYLLHEGLFDRIREELGEYIAKSSAWTPCPLCDGVGCQLCDETGFVGSPDGELLAPADPPMMEGDRECPRCGTPTSEDLDGFEMCMKCGWDISEMTFDDLPEDHEWRQLPPDHPLRQGKTAGQIIKIEEDQVNDTGERDWAEERVPIVLDLEKDIVYEGKPTWTHMMLFRAIRQNHDPEFAKQNIRRTKNWAAAMVWEAYNELKPGVYMHEVPYGRDKMWIAQQFKRFYPEHDIMGFSGGRPLAKVAALLDEETIADLTNHIWEIAAKYGVDVRWGEDRANAWAAPDLVMTPRIRYDIDYLVALHEVGHVVLQAEQQHPDWDFYDEWSEVEEEAQVWRWALDNAIIPISPEMVRQAKWDLGTYHDHAADTFGKPREPEEIGENYKWVLNFQTKVAYTDELQKWVYVPSFGGQVWTDVEFSRSMQEKFLNENWGDNEFPPDFEYDSHSDRIMAMTTLHPTDLYKRGIPYAHGMYDPAKNTFSIDEKWNPDAREWVPVGIDPEEINEEVFGGKAIYDNEGDLRDVYGKRKMRSVEDAARELGFDPDELFATANLWDRVTTKVIYDFDKDQIILGTQATAADLPHSKIIGEYADDAVTLFEAEKQWINPGYFHRLWQHTFPNRPLKDVYYRRGDQSEYKLKTRTTK